ncbi:uncharacterized protein LOC109542314 [Dendroctonus ponderosae]|uniref:uncharacterized protein LOC109542314 n=1 Tax=Dendroctonus ponderosae TaxID=77166 RepID=UPI002034ABCA|nr:uncharacterized protein LOC109542314 [Dendroctonus ponderosae]KAH1014532.1 hypothetical protein HUJ05_012387 [Dendroctonus ponderosae]
MNANLTPYEFFLPSDEDSNSSDLTHIAEKNLTSRKAESTVGEVTSSQDTEETTKRKTYCQVPKIGDIEKTLSVPDIPKEAAMMNYPNVSASDKTKQLDVAELKFISPIKSEGSGGLESLMADVCDSKTKASQSAVSNLSDTANISRVIDASAVLPDQSQDHEEKVLADDDDDDQSTAFKAAEHGVLLNNSADETVSEFLSTEHSKSSCLEEPATIRIESEELEKPSKQNGPSDNQNESLIKPLENVNSEENMEVEFAAEPSIDVSMTEPGDEIMPEVADSLDKPVKNCAQALQDYIRQKINEDDDSSSENSEPEMPCNGFIDGMAEEGEEDTPSEDSNAIPDQGESIGSSDTEASNFYDSGSNDSFICDDEEDELLSGNEYDLGYERKKSKKSRIIDADLLGDDDIIKVPRKKAKEVPTKRKRIVEMYDSSSDDETAQHISPRASCQGKEPSKVSINEITPVVAEETTHSVQEEITENAKEAPKNGHLADVVIGNISIITTDSDMQKMCKNSFISIHQNTGVEDKSTAGLNTLVEEFSSAVKNGKISLNICHRCDDLASLVLSNTLIRDKVKQVIETETDRNDSPNSAKSGADFSGAKNSPNSKSKSTDNVAGVKKKKRKLKTKITASDLSEDQSAAERLERRLVKAVNGRDAENTQKRARLKRKLRERISDSSEENLFTKQQKHKKASRITLSESLFKKRVADLRTDISLIERLITDVKNRPRRAIKPSTTAASEVWSQTEVLNVAPSTSLLFKKRVPKKCIRRILKPVRVSC